MTIPAIPPLAALSWGIVAVGVAVALRLVLKPPFRRDLEALPVLRVWILAGGLVGAGLGLWLLVRGPLLIHAAAGATLATMAFLWWRARPAYGRGRGWPPGSLGLGASLDAIDNRDFYLEQATRHGPIFKMSQFGRPVLCVVGLAHGRKLLQDQRDALTGASLPYNRFVNRGILRYQTRATHQVEGPLYRRAFAAIELDRDEPAVRDALRRLLAAFVKDCRQPAGGDIRPLIRSWSTRALSNAFFGLHADDPRVGLLDAAQQAMDLDRASGAAWQESMQRGLSSATAILREAGREHAANDDSASVLGALVVAAPESLEDEGRLRNLFFMFRLGILDLSGALTWVVYQISAHPEWQERVRSAGRTNGRPRGTQPPDLASRVVLETLRLEQSEFVYRRVVKPLEFEGFRIPAGWIVRICIQESHRDPRTFPDPATFDPDRFADRAYSRSEYATFGLDEYGCLGTSMVLFFGRIIAEEFCMAYAARTTDDSPYEHGTRHRHHWRPGHAWRVALEPVSAPS